MVSFPISERDFNHLITVANWNEIVQAVNLLAALVSPTGSVMDYAGATAPDGWLLCDGSAVSRETYADLFAAIGVTYGVGDGTTTFNLPDLRGRVTGGKDDMGGTSANRLTGAWADTLGGADGEEEHELSMAEMATDVVRRNSANLNRATSGGSESGASTTRGLVNNQTSLGAGQAHNNVQPTMALNKIIKI